ncbi:hypothetical protein [Plantactinospora sp. BB1]|uniref:hypothetical protein n=1 Tax=Plantactinospora sp. BB1 TaxID=2071627 RepID=UPI00131EF403|nr:hypothetical protein [Plantactinospora sp. BB1]
MPAAAAVAVAGFGVPVGTWWSALPDGSGFTAVTVLNLLGWLLAVLAGLGLRAADARQRDTAKPTVRAYPAGRD